MIDKHNFDFIRIILSLESRVDSRPRRKTFLKPSVRISASNPVGFDPK
jgi:hypothetical protein